MDLDTKLSSEELLAQFNQDESEATDELNRLTELYYFADFGRLSAGLFHDLATPLSVVLINLEELKEKFNAIDDEKMWEFQQAVDRAFNGTERMMRFLQLAREHVQRKTVLSMFSINQEIQAAIETVAQAHKETALIFERKGDVKIFGNSTQLFQVILNVISNAIDAYAENSDQKKVLIELKKKQTEVLITVQDWGKGISPQNQERVFKPFFTTKVTNKGTGIGLFISRDILHKQFRGELDFISSPRTGTTFTIHLPRRGSLRASE